MAFSFFRRLPVSEDIINTDSPMNKYELSDIRNQFVYGRNLYRIRALIDIPLHGVKAGDLGGYIECEANLSQKDSAWVGGDAKVYARARVLLDALVTGEATVTNGATLYDSVRVDEYAVLDGDLGVFDTAHISGRAYVVGDAKITQNAILTEIKDYLLIGPVGSNRTVTLTKSNKQISAGCFRGNLDEFKAAVRRDYPIGSDYEAAFDFMEYYFSS
jgi:hypothetical protein